MIRVEAVTKRYGPIVAVDGLTFEVAPGETFAVIGPNGAGKTTTLKMILGLARPDTGRIALGPEGLPPHDPRARERLGYVPQRVEFPPARTAAEILEYFAALRGLPAEAAPRALARVGLADVAGRRASELSGGYAQRLSLAQALLGDPNLLILDEPTAGLDPEQRLRFRELLSALAARATVLLSTHQTDDVAALCSRVVVLLGGAVQFNGTARELSALAAGRVWMQTDRDPSAQLAWITGEGMVRHIGTPPDGSQLVDPTVEDGYLTLTGATAEAMA